MLEQWLVLAAVFVSVIYGYKTRQNIAPMALSFSFFIGVGLMHLKVKELLSLLPIQVLFNVLSITYLFGYAIENGTLTALTGKILYSMRRYPRLMMPTVFAVSFLISMSGAGIATAAFMSPITFAVARRIKAEPIVAYTAVAASAIAGANFMYSGGGIVVLNLIKESPFAVFAFPVTVASFLLTAAICLTLFLAVYCIFPDGKCSDEVYEEPQKFTAIQKRTILLLLSVIIVIVVPNFAGEILGVQWILQLARQLDVGFVMMIGGCIASIMRLADDRQVIRMQIPWTTLMMIGSVSLLIGVGQKAGLTDTLAGLITQHTPRLMIAPVMAFSAGLMSVFSSAIGVVIPTLYPLIPRLVAQTQLPAGLLYACVFIAATCTGISPISTTGSMALGGCGSEKVRSNLFFQAIVMPLVMLAVTVILSFLASIIL